MMPYGAIPIWFPQSSFRMPAPFFFAPSGVSAAPAYQGGPC
jgi:hypothetical protein